MALFAVGIGLGSVICEYLSDHKIELGLVPFGSIGLTFFPYLVYQNPTGNSITYGSFFLMGFFGGLYTVPLYAFIQKRTPMAHLSRVIAVNNILNAFFMVLAGGLAIILLKLNFTIPQIFLITSILNACVAIYIYTVVPEFLMRFLTYIIIHFLYRIKTRGLDVIPDDGPAVIVCNHVSFVDALIIAGTIRRPIRFVMDYQIFKMPILNFIFRTAEQGDIVGIFPEGKITKDGSINEFKAGIEKIISQNPVPVIPMALRGLWGSFFSRRYGKAMSQIPKRVWSKISLEMGDLVQPADVTAQDLQKRVEKLRGDWK